MWNKLCLVGVRQCTHIAAWKHDISPRTTYIRTLHPNTKQTPNIIRISQTKTQMHIVLVIETNFLHREQ